MLWLIHEKIHDKAVIVCLNMLIKLLKLVALRVPSLFAVGHLCLMSACCCTCYIHCLEVLNLEWLITSQGT